MGTTVGVNLSRIPVQLARELAAQFLLNTTERSPDVERSLRKIAGAGHEDIDSAYETIDIIHNEFPMAPSLRFMGLTEDGFCNNLQLNLTVPPEPPVEKREEKEGRLGGQ